MVVGKDYLLTFTKQNTKTMKHIIRPSFKRENSHTVYSTAMGWLINIYKEHRTLILN